MAATRLTVVQAALAGIALGASAADSGNGNVFANSDGKTYLHVLNSGGSTYTVTLVAKTTTRPADASFPSQTLSDQVVSVAPGVEKIVGPIPPAYVDSSGDTYATGNNVALKLSPFRLG